MEEIQKTNHPDTSDMTSARYTSETIEKTTNPNRQPQQPAATPRALKPETLQKQVPQKKVISSFP